MKRRFACVLMLACAVFVALPNAQRVTLTDHDKELAIAHGQAERGKEQGLVLTDVGQGIAAAFAAMGNNADKSNSSTGFSCILYTPTTWIEEAAAIAAKEYRPFTPADITPDMLEPVIRIQVNPDVPNYVTASGMVGTSSVQHVVLRSDDKKFVMQPIAKDQFPIEVKNAMGGNATFMGVRAKFNADALTQLRGPKGDKEFFITVIGSTGEEKNFKVKSKHFPLLK